jgi:hypothetical protein
MGNSDGSRQSVSRSVGKNDKRLIADGRPPTRHSPRHDEENDEIPPSSG